MKKTITLSLFTIMLWTSHVSAAEPSRDEVLAAMKKATAYMSENVAVRGGYAWAVNEDLSQRWGEVPARPSQIWLQGGTERVGQVLLDAYEATGDNFFLQVARDAADALVAGQISTGGWHYFIDFDPAGIRDWYASSASKFLFGMEEYRHYYGNATFDDRVTQDAALFLLRFYELTQEDAYREPLLRAMDFILQSQYPNGGWPQRFPVRDEYAHDGFPDYTGFLTLNDGAMEATLELLLAAHETLGDDRYFDAARRGIDALIAMQGPKGQACWAEQYGPDMQPIAARTHEPAGYVVRESIGVMNLLARFYLVTGEERYLEPIPACLDWFDRINRESAEEKYPKPRYWEPGTNRPLYVVRTNDVTPEGYGIFLWTTDPSETRCEDQACEGDGKPIVDVGYFRNQYDTIAALATSEEKSAYLTKMLASAARRPRSDESVAEIVAAMDARGAWITDGIVVNQSNAKSEAELHPKIRGVSTDTFVRRMATLIASIADDWYTQGDFEPQQRVEIVVHNSLDRERRNSPVTIRRKQLAALPDVHEFAITLVDPDLSGRPEPSNEVFQRQGGHEARGETNGAWIPYQLDDLDQDGRWDELFFMSDFEPGQNKVFYLYIGFQNQGWQAHRTHAAIGSYVRHTVPFWESEEIGWKLWFPTDIDVFGKRRPLLMSQRLYMDNLDGYGVSYVDPAFGSDIMQVNNSFGGGGIGVFEDRKKPNVVSRPRFTPHYPGTNFNAGPNSDSRYAFTVLANGPLRSIVRARTFNWDSGKGKYELEQVFSAYAGQSFSSSRVHYSRFDPENADTVFGVGIRKHLGENHYHQSGGIVISGAPEAIRNLDDEGLRENSLVVDYVGTALVVPEKYSPEYVFVPAYSENHAFRIKPNKKLGFEYFIAAGWSEGSTNRSAEEFQKYVLRTAEEFNSPPVLVSTTLENAP
jgi:PelA/Pel-15E family pectate lyase